MGGEGDGIRGLSRKLASSEKKERDKALKVLTRWFSAQRDLGEEDMMKIWKALFYCVWHADKAPVQEDLAEKVASLLDSLSPRASLQYLRTCLSTLRREWAGIDRLRLDKFCLLLRKCVNHVFLALEKGRWDMGRVQEYMDGCLGMALLAQDKHAADGVCLHLADVYVEELRKFLPISADVFVLLLGPFLDTLARGSSKVVLARVKQAVFEALLEDGNQYADRMQLQGGEDKEAGARSFGNLLVTSTLRARLFELASALSTPQANRKTLFELHDAFTRLDLKVSALRIEIPRDLSGLEKTPRRSSLRRREKAANESLMAHKVFETVEKAPVSKKARKRVGATGSVDEHGHAQDIEPARKAKKKCADACCAADAELSTRSRVGKKRRSSVDANGSGSASAELSTLGPLRRKSPRKVASRNLEEIPQGQNAGRPDEIGQNEADSSAGEEIVLRRARKGAKGSIRGTKKKARQGRDEADGGLSPSLSLEQSPSELGFSIRTVSSVALPQGVSENGDSAPTVNGAREGPAEQGQQGDVHVDQSVICNLEKTIASIPLRAAADGHTDLNGVGGKKKRKRASVEKVSPHTPGGGVATQAEAETPKPKKKVRISLKNNIVWKPHSGPLPPQIMRTPPAATPRGSAMKPGVPPGPVIMGKVHVKGLPKTRTKTRTFLLRRMNTRRSRSRI